MATLTGNQAGFLELLLRRGREPFLLLDSRGIILAASRRLEELLGREPGSLEGHAFAGLAGDGAQDHATEAPPAEGTIELSLTIGEGRRRLTRWQITVEDHGSAAFLCEFVPCEPAAGTAQPLDLCLYQHLCDCLPVGILVTDREGRIILYNRTQERVTGIPREAALGATLFRDYASQAPAPALASFRQALEQGEEGPEHEFDYTDRFGVRRRFRARFTPLPGPDGTVRGAVQTLEDISRPRAMEFEINRTRGFLKRLLETTPNPIFTTDLNGRITFFNHSASLTLGLEEREEGGGLHTSALLLGGEREYDRIRELLWEHGGTLENYETYFVDADHRELPVDFTASVLYDQESGPVGTIVIMRNLTRERKLESEIRESEHYLAVFIQNSPDAVITLDEHGRVQTWNHGAAKLFGFSREEMLGGTLDRLAPPESFVTGEIDSSIRRLFEQMDLTQHQTELYSAHGERLVVEATSSVLREPDGRLQGRLIIFRDITERAQLEDRLQDHIAELARINEISEALLSSKDLTETLGVILIGVTASQGLGFNRAFMLLIDHQQEALVGKLAIGPSNPHEAGIIWNELYQRQQSLLELLQGYRSSILEDDIHVNDLVRRIRIPLSDTANPLVRCLLSKESLNLVDGVNTAGFPRELVELLDTDTLAVVPMVCDKHSVGLILADNLINRRPIEEESVRRLRVFANLASQAIERSRLNTWLQEKIADLDQALRELKESRDKLLRSEKLSAVGEVAAHVAHEIRNPLVCIGGFTRALLRDAATDERTRTRLEIILDEVERLERYLRDTLTFIRPNVPEFQRIDPNQLVAETIQMLEPEIDRERFEVRLQLLADPPRIEIDPDQIRQVLLNIFRNAFEAMPDGGRLTISSRLDDSYFTLSVADTGVGIDQQTMEKLFTAFFTTKSTGSGLGLAISSQIINNHRGTIGLSSRPGEGTVFHITLPVDAPERKEPVNEENPDRG